MTARFDKLRRTLRTGGWVGHAQNLPSYVATHGTGCTRTRGELTLRFVVQEDQAKAYLVGRNSHRLVADEVNVYLTLKEAKPEQREETTYIVKTHLPPRLNARLRRYANRSGRSLSSVLARAAHVYLQAQGEP